MGSGLPGIIWAIVALALLWLGIAAAVTFVAARRFALAERVLGAAQANATLLELTPARPLVVRADGRIEADAQLVRDLGLSAGPSHLADLGGINSGLAQLDLEALIETVEAARVSAGRVSSKVHAAGSGRV